MLNKISCFEVKSKDLGLILMYYSFLIIEYGCEDMNISEILLSNKLLLKLIDL